MYTEPGPAALRNSRQHSRQLRLKTALTAALAAVIGSCSLTPPAEEARLPAFLQDDIEHRYYDGGADDLLTAGLGMDGLRRPAPAFADPLAPTRAELRRNRIHYNYNGIVNITAGSGYGEHYGPGPGGEKVAGHEYLSVSRYPDGSIAATLMVQVPDSFDPRRPCIVTAPSSGSRGVYGAIGTAGAWGLGQGCAVAYTDKGTGTGFYFSDTQTGFDMDGVAVHGDKALFSSGQPSGDSAPARHRIAVKHSHSGHNVEKDWGRFVLQSVQMAFYLLNQHHRDNGAITRDNTLVIASSISNGGNSSIKATEQDSGSWIDAVVVSEPNLALPPDPSLQIYDQHGRLPLQRPLLDIATHFAIYQGCASLLPAFETAPMAAALTPALRLAYGNRCRALQRRGLLSGGEQTEVEQLALQAQEKLLAYGVLEETLPLGLVSNALQLWESVAVTYTSAYGRYRAGAPVCDISFASVDATGKVTATAPAVRAGLASFSSGIPPFAAIQLIHDKAGDRALASTLPFAGGGDAGLEALLCLRRKLDTEAVQAGLAEINFSADLQGRPAIIVHGRSDHLIHVNHSSRPYLASNRRREGDNSRLHYYEVERGQHFDALLRLPEFASRYVPLNYYFEQAMDLMWAHLTEGRPLPPSQVVPARPAAGGTPPLPAISATPGEHAITVAGDKIVIP